MASLTDTTIQPDATLESLVDRILEISSFPHVATRVLEIMNNSDSSVKDLQEVVECDPALVSRILRTVNSSAYATRTRVDSIHRAISLLGFNEIKNLTLTASVTALFRQDALIGTYSRSALWKHLVCVAVTARFIAARSGLARFDEAYMSGLLHDIGLILLDQHLNEAFTKMVSTVSTNRPTIDVEREMLGFDHASVGAGVAKKWGFPPCIVEAIRCHHDSESCDAEHQEVVRAVEIANFLCSRKGITSVGLHNVRPPAGSTFSALSIGRDDLAVLWKDLDDELRKAQELCEI